jgi:hypothetical protein
VGPRTGLDNLEKKVLDPTGTMLSQLRPQQVEDNSTGTFCLNIDFMASCGAPVRDSDWVNHCRSRGTFN